MKNLVVIVLLIISFSTKADTIRVWHVFYNKIKIKEFLETDKNQKLILKLSDLKKGDSISVKYFSDTPCEDCLTGLVLNYDDEFLMVGKSVGRGKPISFPVDFLIDRKKKKMKLIYMDSNGDKASSIPLFEIEFN